MKKLIFLMMIMMMLTGCSSGDSKEYSENYPYVQYQHSKWTYDSNNQMVKIKDGYILDQGHSYDVVETENGYDLILHFIEE